MRGRGGNLADAFANAALAMTAVIAAPGKISPKQAVSIQCQAPDRELLLFDWLNTLILEMATRHMLFSRFEVRIEDHRLTARAWGETVDRERHQPAVEVKGATFMELRVTQEPKGDWMAQAVVDV